MKLAVKVSEIITETLKEELNEKEIKRKKSRDETGQRKTKEGS